MMFKYLFSPLTIGKVEVKNLNSFKFVRKAITFEIERQTEILSRGGGVSQETRLWNENRDVTERECQL